MQLNNLTLCCIFLCLIGSCKKENDRRNISPHAVEFNGIHLYQTAEELRDKIPSLKCRDAGFQIQKCVWELILSEKRGSLQGVRDIEFTFEENLLTKLVVHCDQMLDLEYRLFEKKIRNKYNVQPQDTVTTEWQHDSLKVTLIPNEREHWTKKLSIFTPELVIEESIPLP